MSFARAIRRGAFLNARFAVNGIQKDSRSLGTVARRAAGVGAIKFLRHARACPGHPRLTDAQQTRRGWPGIGERSNAVLRTTMPGHDDCLAAPNGGCYQPPDSM